MGILADQGIAIQSKAFAIWTRLYTRFSLEPGPSVIGGQPEVATSIIPVTQVDELLKVAKADKSELIDLSGGGGAAIAMLTVPTGKRWQVGTIFRSSTTGSSRVVVIDPELVPTNITNSGTSEEMVQLGTRLVLDEGWAIGMRETGNGADVAELIHVTFTEEDAF